MRITIVLGPFYPVPPVLGGAVEKVHLLLAEAFAALGHEVIILSRRFRDFPTEETINGVKHLRLTSSDRTSSLWLNLILDCFYALRVSRDLPISDITVTNSFFTPVFLRRRSAGKIYVHVARYPKGQMILYSRADRLQAISRAVAAAVIEQSPRLANKVATVGYPVHDAFFCSGSPHTRKKVVLFVGRIAREKGLHLLIKAFAIMRKRQNAEEARKWTLRIIGPHEVQQGGDGSEYLNELRLLAKDLGPACEFAGPIFDQENLIKEYKSASVFIYPSLAESGEAFGLAPLEAMAAGCAVIVSDLRCFDDFAVSGKTVLKFDHRRPDPEEDLASKLGQFIADPSAVDQIGKSGNMVARQFRLPAITEQMLEDFKSLTADKI